MSEKKMILIVIPNLCIGGTNSSLEHLYDVIKDKYDVDIFSVTVIGGKKWAFSERLIKENTLLSYVYGNYDDAVGAERRPMFWVKIFSNFCRKMRVPFERVLHKSVARKLSKSDYDMVIAFQEGSTTSLVSYVNKPKLAWIHCNYAFRKRSLTFSEEAIYDKYNKVVCVSRHTAVVFKNIYPSLADKTTYFYNVLDRDMMLEGSEKDIDDSRFDHSQFTIISVGRVDKVKRFREIPAVAAMIKANGLDFKWYIIGPETNKQEVHDIEENIVKYDVADRVIPLGGKNNPYPYYKSANLYACLSESEACPMVFKEAQTFGLPIVSTDFPSAVEFVEESKTGYIMPLEGIAKPIIRLISDNELYKQLQANVEKLQLTADIDLENFEKLIELK